MKLPESYTETNTLRLLASFRITGDEISEPSAINCQRRFPVDPSTAITLISLLSRSIPENTKSLPPLRSVTTGLLLTTVISAS